MLNTLDTQFSHLVFTCPLLKKLGICSNNEKSLDWCIESLDKVYKHVYKCFTLLNDITSNYGKISLGAPHHRIVELPTTIQDVSEGKHAQKEGTLTVTTYSDMTADEYATQFIRELLGLLETHLRDTNTVSLTVNLSEEDAIHIRLMRGRLLEYSDTSLTKGAVYKTVSAWITELFQIKHYQFCDFTTLNLDEMGAALANVNKDDVVVFYTNVRIADDNEVRRIRWPYTPTTDSNDNLLDELKRVLYELSVAVAVDILVRYYRHRLTHQLVLSAQICLDVNYNERLALSCVPIAQDGYFSITKG